MLKECDIALPKTLADRVLAAQTLPQATMIGVEESGDHVNDVLPSLDTRRLFQNFVPIAVHSLRLAYPTKPELLYIITQLFPRYLEPVLSAIEKGSDPPGTSRVSAKKKKPKKKTTKRCFSLNGARHRLGQRSENCKFDAEFGILMMSFLYSCHGSLCYHFSLFCDCYELSFHHAAW